MLVHRRVTPNSKFAGTNFYTRVDRGNIVKFPAQEHNAVPRLSLDPESGHRVSLFPLSDLLKENLSTPIIYNRVK